MVSRRVKLGVETAAEFAGLGREYRYTLHRTWDKTKGVVLWVMLNPSTADADQDDPTVAKCQTYARLWGYGAIVVTNLCAFRSTSPTAMKRYKGDPVGRLNDYHIEREAVRADLVICAWGTDGAFLDRGATVLSHLREIGIHPQALRITKGGFPSHPLYLPLDLLPSEIPS